MPRRRNVATKRHLNQHADDDSSEESQFFGNVGSGSGHAEHLNTLNNDNNVRIGEGLDSNTTSRPLQRVLRKRRVIDATSSTITNSGSSASVIPSPFVLPPPSSSLHRRTTNNTIDLSNSENNSTNNPDSEVIVIEDEQDEFRRHGRNQDDAIVLNSDDEDNNNNNNNTNIAAVEEVNARDLIDSEDSDSDRGRGGNPNLGSQVLNMLNRFANPTPAMMQAFNSMPGIPGRFPIFTNTPQILNGLGYLRALLDRRGRIAPPSPPRNQANLQKVKYNPPNDTEPVECTICLEKLKKNGMVYKTGCDHMFHVKCLDGWLRSTTRPSCPNCRADLHK